MTPHHSLVGFFFFLAEVQLIYNVVLVSDIKQSVQLYIYILSHNLSHYVILQDTEYSSLCHTVRPHCLSVFYIMCLLVTLSCPACCNPIDCSPTGSSVHGVLQAGILKQVSISSPGDLSDPELNQSLPHCRFFTSEPLGKPVGCHALLQGIFPTQGSNPGLAHCRWILYQLSHQESPRVLEWIAQWVAMPFFQESSRPRNQIRVSWIKGGVFTS